MIRRTREDDAIARITESVVECAVHDVRERERGDGTSVPGRERTAAGLMTKRTIRGEVRAHAIGAADRFVVRFREGAQPSKILGRVFEVARGGQSGDLVGSERV